MVRDARQCEPACTHVARSAREAPLVCGGRVVAVEILVREPASVQVTCFGPPSLFLFSLTNPTLKQQQEQEGKTLWASRTKRTNTLEKSPSPPVAAKPPNRQQQPQHKSIMGSSGADLVIDTNKNVNWMDSRGFWTFYGLLLGSLYMATPVLVPSPHKWTVVNVLHGIVTFGIMHWIKGSPDDSNSMGDYRELTFYEQIDQGHPWTGTKRFLMIVPTVLFMLASITTDYDTVHLCINFPIWATLILAKLPELDRVRIFGINSTVGIDDVVKKGKNE